MYAVVLNCQENITCIDEFPVWKCSFIFSGDQNMMFIASICVATKIAASLFHQTELQRVDRFAPGINSSFSRYFCKNLLDAFFGCNDFILYFTFLILLDMLLFIIKYYVKIDGD